MEIIRDLFVLIGRLCMGWFFIWAAFEKLVHWSGTVAYIQRKNLPFASVALPLAVLIQILGGVSLFLGYHIRMGAVLLILFIIPAAIYFHDFWNLEGEERITEKTLFMKDVAILGGLLLILAWGGGRFSLV